MSSKFLKASLEANLPNMDDNASSMIDLMDEDLDAVAGGAACVVLVVKCETTYTVSGGGGTTGPAK